LLRHIFGEVWGSTTVDSHTSNDVQGITTVCNQERPIATKEPTTHLLGISETGEFRTACAKEYPSRLNQSFALAIKAKLDTRRLGTATETPVPLVETFGKSLAVKSASTECGTRMPDYQPVT